MTQETVTMTQRLVVFGKEYELPNPMSDNDIRANLVSVVRELDADAADRLSSEDYDVRTEEGAVVVYRGASFG